uniref:BY PROTMAP: gi/472585768/gb/EMS23319.1/ protein of lipase, class 3 family [Rhodosporidium toruloides NP11] gi/647400544/emb/CDR46103.1/ RHTO0S12e00474g1_1 [Rhodosporidium toruloides] n=1 Tax=Rhodotorula toruloides TaxID=5286 RepID=A0A0K3CUC5_RHOTO
MRTTLVAAAATAAFSASALAQTAADVSSSQYERYHGLLSMAAYSNDPTTVCAQTFDQAALTSSFPNSTEAPWTLIQQFGPTAMGTQGFSVVIPEMDKVVIVFKGMFGWESTFNDSTVNIGTLLNLGPNCTDCTAHSAATAAYLEAREITNDFELEQYYVNQTGHQFSVTGHGWGGMLAQVAAIDLGWRGLVRWSHSHGAARVFNPPAAALYNSLFGGEAGQRTVANDDPVPTYIPESANYTFTLQGFHITGNGTSNATYGYDYAVCNDASEAECAGTVGGNFTDHLAYYTPIGMCGKPYWGSNTTVEESFQSTASQAFYATATSTFVPPTMAVTTSSTSSSSAASSAVSDSSAGAQTATAVSGANAAASPSAGADHSGAASASVVGGGVFAAVLAAGLALLA